MLVLLEQCGNLILPIEKSLGRWRPWLLLLLPVPFVSSRIRTCAVSAGRQVYRSAAAAIERTSKETRVGTVRYLEEIVEEGGHHGMALAVIGLLQGADKDADVLRQRRQNHLQTLGIGRHLYQNGQAAQKLPLGRFLSYQSDIISIR